MRRHRYLALIPCLPLLVFAVFYASSLRAGNACTATKTGNFSDPSAWATCGGTGVERLE